MKLPTRPNWLVGMALLWSALHTAVQALAPTIAITHAAGRMGKLLALQLHERDPQCKVRAICRTGKEKRSIRFDLGGIKLVDGKMVPAVSHDDWLEIMVVPDDRHASINLQGALKGTATAVLCSASHNQVVPNETKGSSVRVQSPPGEAAAAEQIRMQDRLVAEVRAALATPGMEHVILRSSMGLDPATPEELSVAMGGPLVVDGAKRAEEMLSKCDSDDDNKVSTTILRLGALTDDTGPIPLEFSSDDKMLRNREVAIPLISRADAARVLGHSALQGAPLGLRRCADVAWKVKYGAHSLLLDDVRKEAVYQDLEGQLMIAATGSATV